jgi:3-keto-L-gulonate-6-phosphate decarboxylase
MANALYDPGREGFLDGSIDWDTDDIREMLVLSSYAFSAAHKFVADLGAVDNGRSAALGSKTVANGVADAADISLVATAATASKALVYFKHTGVDATARLIAYVDTPTAGLPFTPSAGQTVNITHDNGANKIFKL